MNEPDVPYVGLLVCPANHDKQEVPAQFARLPAGRPDHGTLGQQVELRVNMFKLDITGTQIFHWDVTFERVRAVCGRGAGAWIQSICIQPGYLQCVVIVKSIYIYLES